MAAIGQCICCGKVFSFSPERVPSVVFQGSKEPVCRSCVERANEERKKLGLAPHPILPGAYDRRSPKEGR